MQSGGIVAQRRVRTDCASGTTDSGMDSMRHSTWTRAGRLGLLAAGMLCGMASAAGAPTFGAWRNLHSASGSEPVLQDLAFALLPTAAEKGERFAILDRESKRTVCCLVVDSERLDAIALETRYHLPGVWIADLLGSEERNRRQGDPRVYAMTRDAELVDYAYSELPEAYSDLGGLLLPAGAALEPGGIVKFGAAHWTLQFRRLPLADENGALDRYTLLPSTGGPAQVVEVPFSTY